MEKLNESSLLDWLLEAWPANGPAVCALEGQSGIGKTPLAQKVRRAWDGPSVLVAATDASEDIESLFFAIAAKLEADGCSVVADHPGQDFRAGILELLRQPSLIVIDDLDEILSPETRVPPTSVMEFVRDVCDLGGDGRVLLISATSLGEGQWLDQIAVRTMAAPSKDRAGQILQELLQGRGLEDELTSREIEDVVTWLGRNPRAMQAFVACLREAPLQELIDLDTESWELRDRVASPILVQRLERKFLSKTIQRLDPSAVLLLEGLSVHRRPFTIDAIRQSAPRGVPPEMMKDALTSRFLLERDRRWYSLNPVARQLCLARLVNEQRRKRSVHELAATHYSRRITTGGYRDLVRSGSDLVEARFHLLQAGRDTEFQKIASQFRDILISNYRDVSQLPADQAAAEQLLATLMAAIHDIEDGHHGLRYLIAQLLLRRARPGDRQQAYRQITVATRRLRSRGAWLLRLRLASEIDTANAVVAVAEQALTNLRPSDASQVATRAAETLARNRNFDMASRVLEAAKNALPPQERQRVISAAAFVLTVQRRAIDAVDLLLDHYREGIDMGARYRLFEQAVFISLAMHDRERIRRARQLVVDDGLNEHQSVLCDVLVEELAGNYRNAAELGEHHEEYAAVAAQSAFCWLVERNPMKAKAVFDRSHVMPNRAAWWLRSVLAMCCGAGEVYREAMARTVGHPLTDTEASDPYLWLTVWTDVPSWIDVFPAFYFPRLPAMLTGFSDDIEYTPGEPLSVADLPLFNMDLPIKLQVDGSAGASASGDEDAPDVATGTDRAVMTTDMAAARASGSSQTDDLGPAFGAASNVQIVHVSLNSTVLSLGLDRNALLSELRQLVDDIANGSPTDSSEGTVVALDDAVAAFESGDDVGAVGALRRAGGWALKRAQEIGSLLAAAAIQKALGLA